MWGYISCIWVVQGKSREAKIIGENLFKQVIGEKFHMVDFIFNLMFMEYALCKQALYWVLTGITLIALWYGY